MSLKFALPTLLFVAALPAIAQAPATPPAAAQSGPPPAQVQAIQTAAQAFGACVQTGVGAVPASATPDAGAATVLAGCASQRTALVSAVNTMIAGMPADQRTAAQGQADAQLAPAMIQSQIASAISSSRTAAAAPATPATPAH